MQTWPGKGWNVILRLYGPLEPWFDKSWRPGEIEEVKSPATRKDEVRGANRTPRLLRYFHTVASAASSTLIRQAAIGVIPSARQSQPPATPQSSSSIRPLRTRYGLLPVVPVQRF